MTDAAVDNLIGMNLSAGAAFRPSRRFSWDHLRGGFCGFHCPEVAGWPVLTEEDLRIILTTAMSEGIPPTPRSSSDEDWEM
eukprot:11948016-Alexandrium_andersonii.AAC.1